MSSVVKIVTVLFALLAASPAWAEDDFDDGDHKASEEVYVGKKSGVILPLQEILKRAKPLIDGEIIETKFGNKGGRPAYEIYFLDSNGRRKEIYLDARTGALAQTEEDD